MQWPWSRPKAGRTAATPEAAPADPPIEALDGPIEDYLKDLLARIAPIVGGNVATYIPELAKANPGHCAIAIATADGRLYSAGDADVAFTIQSVSKPFLYGCMLDEFGREMVLEHVGVEPTGDAFNALVFDEANNRPSNPMVNAGAIAVAALVKGSSVPVRIDTVREHFSHFAGRQLSIDESVWRSEQETGDTNRAIAAAMKECGMMDGDPAEHLDVYFAQCSVLVTAKDLAMMGATLANGGVHPRSGERVLSNESVCDVITVMNTCGMYNYAGQWSYEIGMPAKSGVSGSIVAVIPGQAGIAIYSPPIDDRGNSVRAIAACKLIAEEFGLHYFRVNPAYRNVIRRVMKGAVARSKRVRTQAERQALDAASHDLVVIEAQDALYFGSAERLLREAADVAEAASTIILDFRRVYAVDNAARMLLMRLYKLLKVRGKKLIFAGVQARGALAPLRTLVAETLGDEAGILFDHRDQALEWWENQVISAMQREAGETKFALTNLDIFAGLDAESVRLLEAAATPLVFEAGQTIVREGDPARMFFVITRGVASVWLRVDRGDAPSVRVASIGPGMAFGEMALLDGKARSADVIADDRVVAYGFSVEQLRELGETQPKLLVALYANMARELSERLRRTSNEVRALEH